MRISGDFEWYQQAKCREKGDQTGGALTFGGLAARGKQFLWADPLPIANRYRAIRPRNCRRTTKTLSVMNHILCPWVLCYGKQMRGWIRGS